MANNLLQKSINVHVRLYNRLQNYRPDLKNPDKISSLLDIVTPRKGKFIWYLDVEKYNEDRSRNSK